MHIVTRAEWGANAGLGPRMPGVAREVWIHHSVTTATGDPAADMRGLERIGVSRFGRFSYSYAVHPSGVVMEGAGLTVGAHTANRNSTSFGIVWIGNYETDQPTGPQLEATAELIRWLMDSGSLRPGPYPTGGHRDAPGASTACPGGNAYGSIPYLRALVTNGVPTPAPPVQEDDDMLIVVSTNGSRGFWLESANGFEHILNPLTVEAYKSAGVKFIKIDESDFAEKVKRAETLTRMELRLIDIQNQLAKT